MVRDEIKFYQVIEYRAPFLKCFNIALRKNQWYKVAANPMSFMTVGNIQFQMEKPQWQQVLWNRRLYSWEQL